MSNHFYLYRVRVLSYPKGSHRAHQWPGEDWPVPDENWSPPGWNPSPEYEVQFGTRRFIWPKSDSTYKSRSSAKKRAALLEYYGARAVVERSSRITWPDQSLNDEADEAERPDNRRPAVVVPIFRDRSTTTTHA
jgi:hypothetical protein